LTIKEQRSTGVCASAFPLPIGESRSGQRVCSASHPVVVRDPFPLRLRLNYNHRSFFRMLK